MGRPEVGIKYGTVVFQTTGHESLIDHEIYTVDHHLYCF